MAKKKLNKAQRREQRLRKARQWIVTYKGTPKKIVKHYKERFHVDTVCALKDLQEIGCGETQRGGAAASETLGKAAERTGKNGIDV